MNRFCLELYNLKRDRKHLRLYILLYRGVGPFRKGKVNVEEFILVSKLHLQEDQLCLELKMVRLLLITNGVLKLTKITSSKKKDQMWLNLLKIYLNAHP